MIRKSAKRLAVSKDNVGHIVADHFPDVRKMILMPKEDVKKVERRLASEKKKAIENKRK